MSQSFFGRPMEILLVEDSQADAAITMRVLKEGKIRHRLSIAARGEEAWQFLNREGQFRRVPRPDLILLDLNLPGMDGRELLKEIRSNEDERLSKTPVVVMTGCDDHQDALEREMLEVEAYISKPLDAHEFIRLVKQLKSHWHADVILPLAE